MLRRWSRWGLVGAEVLDGAGVRLGRVVDTYPFDGGSEVELIVVRLPRFGGRRMVPVDDLVSEGFAVRTPYLRWQVEDSPELSGGRHAIEDPERAKSYWRFEEPARPLALA